MKLATLAAFVVGCVPFFLVLFACGAAPTAPLAIEGAADEAEQDLCVKNAASRADADLCRKNVQIKYAALMASDAGSDASK